MIFSSDVLMGMCNKDLSQVGGVIRCDHGDKFTHGAVVALGEDGLNAVERRIAIDGMKLEAGEDGGLEVVAS